MEVFERPADTYVASFIGAPAMNFLPGTLTESGTAVRLEAGPVIAFAGTAAVGPGGLAVTIGIRPEHVGVDTDPLGVGDAAALPTTASLRLDIDLVEPLGSETLMHGRLHAVPGQEIVARVAGHAMAADQVTLRLTAADLHLFDRASGRRLPPAGG
jgi:sn-glycerol 3-phosphate transport system ATP-binding protein